MCYKCTVCNKVCPQRTPLRKHTIYRKRPGTLYNEIAREIPVCAICQLQLERGKGLESLVNANRTWTSPTGFKIKLN